MFTVSMDARPFIKDMDVLAQRQIPFAMMKTLNNDAEDVQADEQEHVARKFTLRRPQFILNTVKINRGDWATKENLRSIVRIDPDRDVLSKFEDQGQKTAMFSGHSLAVPIEARRGKRDIVLGPYRPKALELTQVSSRGSIKIAKGLKRTFLIQRADGSGGIYQRMGAGVGSTIRLLYTLKTRVPLPRSLQFVENATRVVAANTPINWTKWFAEAMRTAR